tara:strand:- start:1572 stop:2363 length:792 start_codon:yes stop_codon:yes gene_type:complete
MINRYLLILKNRDHILFLVLALVSTLILLNNNDPRMSVVRGKSADLVAFLSSPVSWVRSLMYLEEENRLLRDSNLFLTLQIESMLNLENENKELKEILGFKSKTDLTIVPARVVNKGTQSNLLSVILNVGSKDNVKKNQPVLTAKGIIGKTIFVGETASIVQLINDVNYRVSVRILPSGATGILKWVGNRKAEIKEVQKNVNISIGDEVITSGYSDIYPSGLPVGIVAGVIDKRGSFHKDVTVSIPNDLSVFQHAFVIIGRND